MNKRFCKLFGGILLVLLTLSNTTTFAALNNQQVNAYMRSMYSQFKFNRDNKIKFEVFEAAAKGYINLKEEGKISRPVLTICDFSLSSNMKRMWILDMNKHKILLQTYVAHGQGSGEEFANRFSNTHESHQSSQGFYVTGGIYQGNNGESLKLYGVDGSYNSEAYDRAIVLHGADYVNESFIRNTGRLGRSYGCPAVDRNLSHKIIAYIKNGSVLFIYHPANNYLRNSRWINNPISQIQNVALSDINENEVSESIVKKPIPKTQEDSLRMGLVKVNTKLNDGSYYVGEVKMTPEEYEAFKKRKEKEDQALKLRLSSGINPVSNSVTVINSRPLTEDEIAKLEQEKKNNTSLSDAIQGGPDTVNPNTNDTPNTNTQH